MPFQGPLYPKAKPLGFDTLTRHLLRTPKGNTKWETRLRSPVVFSVAGATQRGYLGDPISFRTLLLFFVRFGVSLGCLLATMPHSLDIVITSYYLDTFSFTCT
jgi:hypothetical protein